MNKRVKWLISIGALLLVASLIFNGLFLKTIRGFTTGAQGEFMLGWGTSNQAYQDYTKGDKTNAKLDMERGVGYLNASSHVMNQLGVNGVMGLGMYFDKSMSYLLSHTNASDTQQGRHYEQVIGVFISAFKPFSRSNYGSINNRQLQKSVLKVYQAMTPQERNQYQGWGP